MTADDGGRRSGSTNLDKVLYPETGTTKAEVLQYYLVRGARAARRSLRDRPVTRKRWPDGVDHDPFFEKNMPRGAPEWIPRVTQHHDGSRSGRGARDIDYPLVDDEATVAWLAQSGALELHAPQWRVDRATGDAARRPTASWWTSTRERRPAWRSARTWLCSPARCWQRTGYTAYAVTSGSKGMQLYAGLPASTERGRAVMEKAGSVSEYARVLATALERELPDLVVSKMSRDLRPGKVFVDWSQNNPAKTTIVPWSLRGRSRPTVATPVPWEHVERGELHQRDLHEAMVWYADHHDLLEPLSDGA